MAWTDLSGAFGYGTKLTSAQQSQLRDNAQLIYDFLASCNLTDHSILLGSGTGPVTPLALTDGKLLIGHTGADPDVAGITAGDGAKVVEAAGSITISMAIKVGDYTGDGGTEHAITGVGFQPRFILIMDHETGTTVIFIWHAKIQSGYSLKIEGGEHNEYCPPVIGENWIIAVGADGFSVGDEGDDNNPNKNGKVYDYICIG